MASPQVEDGFIPIANEIAEALMRINLSPYESRVLWFIFRKTYGWGKKTDWITLSQFSACIHLDRRLIFRAIKSLEHKNMVVIEKDDKGNIRYGFQKDHAKWTSVISRDDKEATPLSSAEMTTVICTDDKVSSVEMTGLSSVEIHTIDNITKDNSTINTITKDKGKRSPKAPEYSLPDFIDQDTWDAFEEMRKKIGKPMTDRAKKMIVNEAVRLNQKTGDDINAIIDQSTRNNWQDVYTLKDKTPRRGNQQAPSRTDGIAEWLDRKQKEMEDRT